MRNAAATLGIIAGIVGMMVGFFSYGWLDLLAWAEQENINLANAPDNPGLIRTMSILAPVLAIAGGAMAKARALWGGILLLLSAAGMLYAFDFGVFTMFPIVFAGVGGLLAVAAGKPDEPKAHF
ncbi:hypothetical protein [Pseudaestuariivita atlantica]|uniref:Uncharacterized protein n=1 Tax=Pseudaestuariivita atlantica TaxID=1317121 RepID=A0A0L1JQJ6_9RHOB|nr:hypothetical protein [Pseudaestuariivita atlantica]KNG94006.1 hypothetical protein ATO11_07020 [Pseudaestuariivita atlantica]